MGSLVGGLPIAVGPRKVLESGFGREFGAVRVHTGAAAGLRARELGADAFTHGRDIGFAPGRYRPETAAGLRLLAHEAAHVVQQDFTAQGTAVLRSPASERQAVDAAAAVVRGAQAPRVDRASGIQCQAATSPVAAPAAAPTPVAQPPVLFGFDMSARPPTPYISVTVPGHSLTEIALYLYGTADAVTSLRTDNGDLPDRLAAGRNLRFRRESLVPTTQAAMNESIRAGNVLRSEGMASDSTDTRIYQAVINGSTVYLTEGQFTSTLRGAARWIGFRALRMKDDVESCLETQQWHTGNTNSVIRGISDWMGDADLPAESTYRSVMNEAQALADEVQHLTVTPDSRAEIMGYLPRLTALAEHAERAQGAWHNYIQGTIHGAERTVHYLEITRNVSFGVVAGLAGAVAAPAIFAAAGTGLAAAGVTGAGATLVAGTAAVGGAAAAGGVVRGGLEVALPGAQADVPASQRFGRGFRSGAVAGALGGAGALVAPGVSGAISSRVFGVAPETLGTGARLGVNVATGVTVGVPSGAIGTGIDQAGALASGRISGWEFASRLGSGALQGGAFGGIGGVLPVSGLYRTGGMRLNPFSGEPVTPSWMIPVMPGAGVRAIAQMGSGRFVPLAEGSYMAVHPQFPDVVVIQEGPILRMGRMVGVEFQPASEAPAPWGSGPPPGTQTWAEWTAARWGWRTGGDAPAANVGGGAAGAPAPVSVPRLGEPPRLAPPGSASPTALAPGELRPQPAPASTTPPAAGPAPAPLRQFTGPSLDVQALEPPPTPPVQLNPTRDASGRWVGLPDTVPAGTVYRFPGGERVWRTPDGSIAISSRIGPGPGRAGYERTLPARGEYDIPEYQQAMYELAHSQGQGTGFESPFGIALAPRVVNQALQRWGVEEFLYRLRDQTPAGMDFNLMTNTRMYPGTSRLMWIEYRVDAVTGTQAQPFFSFRIEVTGPVGRPIVRVVDAQMNPMLDDLLDVPNMSTAHEMQRRIIEQMEGGQ